MCSGFFFCKNRSTPSVKACGFASSLREGAFGMAVKFLVMFEILMTGLTACALSVKPCRALGPPKGRAKSTAGKFLIVPNTLATNFTAWLSPWESCHRRWLRGRAHSPRRAALSQKAALQMSFSSTTPPVKMQCRSVRRRSGIALLKIIFPLNMARAQAEAIQNRPTRKRQICPPPFLCPQSVVY